MQEYLRLNENKMNIQPFRQRGNYDMKVLSDYNFNQYPRQSQQNDQKIQQIQKSSFSMYETIFGNKQCKENIQTQAFQGQRQYDSNTLITELDDNLRKSQQFAKCSTVSKYNRQNYLELLNQSQRKQNEDIVYTQEDMSQPPKNDENIIQPLKISLVKPEMQSFQPVPSLSDAKPPIQQKTNNLQHYSQPRHSYTKNHQTQYGQNQQSYTAFSIEKPSNLKNSIYSSRIQSEQTDSSKNQNPQNIGQIQLFRNISTNDIQDQQRSCSIRCLNNQQKSTKFFQRNPVQRCQSTVRERRNKSILQKSIDKFKQFF